MTVLEIIQAALVTIGVIFVAVVWWLVRKATPIESKSNAPAQDSRRRKKGPQSGPGKGEH
jgi:hypothetical protein